MSRLERLLQELCWGIQHDREKFDFKKKRLYELETGILKFCIGLELFQHAWKNEELDVLRQKLFKHVKNMPEDINLDSQIKILESEIDIAITCLKNNKIRSKNLKSLRFYLESLRKGDFTTPEKHKQGGLPMGK